MPRTGAARPGGPVGRRSVCAALTRFCPCRVARRARRAGEAGHLAAHRQRRRGGATPPGEPAQGPTRPVPLRAGGVQIPLRSRGRGRVPGTGEQGPERHFCLHGRARGRGAAARGARGAPQPRPRGRGPLARRLGARPRPRRSPPGVFLQGRTSAPHAAAAPAQGGAPALPAPDAALLLRRAGRARRPVPLLHPPRIDVVRVAMVETRSAENRPCRAATRHPGRPRRRPPQGRDGRVARARGGPGRRGNRHHRADARGRRRRRRRGRDGLRGRVPDGRRRARSRRDPRRALLDRRRGCGRPDIVVDVPCLHRSFAGPAAVPEAGVLLPPRVRAARDAPGARRSAAARQGRGQGAGGGVRAAHGRRARRGRRRRGAGRNRADAAAGGHARPARDAPRRGPRAHGLHEVRGCVQRHSRPHDRGGARHSAAAAAAPAAAPAAHARAPDAARDAAAAARARAAARRVATPPGGVRRGARRAAARGRRGRRGGRRARRAAARVGPRRRRRRREGRRLGGVRGPAGCRGARREAPAVARRRRGRRAPAQRRARAAPSAAADATHGGAGGSVLPEAPATPPSAGGARTQGPAPIDHIFGFHKALKNELAQLEDDAMSLGLGGAAIQEGALQRLAGRFRFLWGIYRAHSHAEDEVVFPALESKERLHNVTNSYAIDHQQEESLFCALDETLARVQDASLASSELGPLIASLQRQCAAIRAAVTLHVRSEEEGLWPLFVEHFTDEEQRQLVGTIIGRTGAEVLQAMLPWVTRSFTEEETGEMMDSLRQVTRKTRFDRWLGAIMATEGASSQEGSEHGCGGCAAAPGGSGHLVLPGGSGGAAGLDDPGQYPSEDELAPLKEVAQYLRRHGGLKDRLKAEVPEASGAVEDESSFEIGWEDLFLMNQNQLEGAVRRMSSDPSLDHSKRAYLIQNLMAAKYIVAQQLRMRRMRDGSVGPSAGSLATRSVELVGDGEPAAAAEPVGAPAAPAVRASRVEGAAPAAEGGAAGSGGAGSPADGAALRTYHDEARGVLGCEHYARSCKLVAPCCGKAYTCRLCHDDAEDHRMDRYAVRSMQCMRCGARGPVGQKCGACGESMASYYCGICHLFDGTEGRDIYHCPFCNTCRRGKGLGVDFFHCMKCNCCMSMTLMNKHQCREGQLESDCPICHELLFDSSQPVRALPCGHFMHSGCFRAYVQYSYTCPLCCKSVHLDMSLYINMIDAILAAERLPEQFAGQTQKIRCRDCERDGEAPFHFVYHKCQHCSSYNTVLR
ncbi:unnamed protein product [Pedinophyceae sp. YPF-701]|nr:unnamed protein product [Pedinophyceae sp. YPF-701]